jgi:radical SAM protein with 4Fe4S-binding SPASM domain
MREEFVKESAYININNYSRHHGGVDKYLENIFGNSFREYRTRWHQLTKREISTDFPNYVVVETLFNCNYSCKMCHKSVEELRNALSYTDVMSMDMYKRIIDECSEHNCPSVCCTGNYEPLMDRLMVERLKYASEKGILDVMIKTNGSLLSEEIADAFIENGLTRLSISLDAASEETYSKIRSKDYKKVVENIERFLSLRDKKKVKLPVLRLSYCVTNINGFEQEAFLNLWKDKVDEISFQRFTPPENRENFKHLYPEDRKVMDFFCSQPFERVVIRGDGNVYPCCYQTMKIPVGNIKENSLYDIWNGDKINEYRRIVAEEQWDANPCCLECSQAR